MWWSLFSGEGGKIFWGEEVKLGFKKNACSPSWKGTLSNVNSGPLSDG